MQLKMAVIMDPIDSIWVEHDSTLAIMLAAQKQGFEVHYFQQKDLVIENAIPFADSKQIKVFYDPKHHYEIIKRAIVKLTDFDVILMRKDPPFDMEYIYTTYFLELAQQQGTLVINNPQSLRDANEKIFITQFPQCIPEHIISKDKNKIRDFIFKQKSAVLKPLHSMGGKSIFHLKQNDTNINATIETLTNDGSFFIMAQKYIPEVTQGDKRILMLNGEPIPIAINRKPAPGELRANIFAGGSSEIQKLSKHDKWICQQVGPTLKAKGLLLVGLDIIGDYLTEINVTSPSCLREAETAGFNVAKKLIGVITRKLNRNT